MKNCAKKRNNTIMMLMAVMMKTRVAMVKVLRMDMMVTMLVAMTLMMTLLMMAMRLIIMMAQKMTRTATCVRIGSTLHQKKTQRRPPPKRT